MEAVAALEVRTEYPVDFRNVTRDPVAGIFKATVVVSLMPAGPFAADHGDEWRGRFYRAEYTKSFVD